MWASVDGAIVRAMVGPKNRGTACQDQQCVVKPACAPFESRKDSAYGDRGNDHSGTELRDAKGGAQRGTSVS